MITRECTWQATWQLGCANTMEYYLVYGCPKCEDIYHRAYCRAHCKTWLGTPILHFCTSCGMKLEWVAEHA